MAHEKHTSCLTVPAVLDQEPLLPLPLKQPAAFASTSLQRAPPLVLRLPAVNTPGKSLQFSISVPWAWAKEVALTP